MSAEQLATRIISERTEIPSSTIRRGGISESDFEKIKDVSIELQNLPFYVDETGGLSIAQLAARARRLKRQRGLDLLVIDYIQLLQGSQRRATENRVQEVTEITTNLKALAKELNVPIMALSQLSRQVESRDDKRPQLSDLRESGSIEQDADVVLFVFREEYYLANKEPRPGSEEHLKWQTEMATGARQGRGHHRQAAPRPDRHRPGAVRRQRHALRRSRPDDHLPERIDRLMRRTAGRALAPRPAITRPWHANPSQSRPRRPEPVTTTGGPPEAEAGGILTIDLGAIFDNYRALAVKVMPTECAAVVKGDAYGCGLEQVTADADRAPAARRSSSRISTRRGACAQLAPEAVIYVLNGFASGTGPAFVEAYARPVINSSVELAEWDQFVATSGWHGGVGLHVDTGMNRLGLSIDETAAVAMRMQSRKPRAHAADEPLRLRRPAAASAQRPADQAIPRNPHAVPRHSRLARQFLRHLPRPIGLLRHGAPGRRALRRQSDAGQAQPDEAGDRTEGPRPAGAQRAAQRHRRLRRDLDRQARQPHRRGRRRLRRRPAARRRPPPSATSSSPASAAAIVGRISMDLLTVDVTDLPDSAVRRGDLVTLIGGELGVDAVGAQAGTIGYEVLTTLGRRYHRIWKV